MAADEDIICQIDDEIVIRRYRDEDILPIAGHASDLAVWNTLSDRMPYPYTVEDSRQWVDLTRKPENQFATGPDIADKEAPRVPASYVIVVNGDPCGNIFLLFQTGVYRLSATLGYWLGSAYHGKGIMSKVAPVFVQWVWKTFGYLIRLNGSAYETNIASQRVMQRAGFKVESLKIDACIKNGVILNEVTLYALRPRMVEGSGQSSRTDRKADPVTL